MSIVGEFHTSPSPFSITKGEILPPKLQKPGPTASLINICLFANANQMPFFLSSLPES